MGLGTPGPRRASLYQRFLFVTSETRRISFCFMLSLVVNAAAFVLAGWIWRPLPVPAAAIPPRLTLVRLAWRPAPPSPVVTPVLPPPPQPAKPVVLKPRPVKPPRPKRLRRPGARVHSHQPAPPAAPSGGMEAGAPAPAIAAPPAAPPPPVITTERPAPRVVHTVVSPPLPAPAPVAASAPAPMPPIPPTARPAAVTGSGAGGTAAGKGAGAGEGTGKGSGAGSGAGRDAGEPFGIGKGMAGDGAPRHVVYVLDISGSMTSRIDRAEAELRRALNGLRPEETFNIVAFSDEVRAFDTGMAPATPEMVRRASAYLDTLQVDGGTNLEGAMIRALTRPGVNEVVLLTDGVPTEGETDFKALAREIRRLNSSHARISAVGMVGRNPDGTDDSFEAAHLLQQITQESGGVAKIVTVGVASP
jgi:hypothetical protein